MKFTIWTDDETGIGELHDENGLICKLDTKNRTIPELLRRLKLAYGWLYELCELIQGGKLQDAQDWVEGNHDAVLTGKFIHEPIMEAGGHLPTLENSMKKQLKEKELSETNKIVGSTTNNNPADTFFKDLQEFRDKYPMVYVECWNPEDFVDKTDNSETGPETIPNSSPNQVDWNNPLHEITADNLYHNFDANYGTNWERVRHESVS